MNSSNGLLFTPMKNHSRTLNPAWIPILALACPGWAGTPAAGQEQKTLAKVSITQAMPHWRDYALMWWDNGWDFKSRALARPKILCFQTGWFGLAIAVENLQPLHLGALTNPPPYELAATGDDRRIFSLAPAELFLAIHCGSRIFRCAGAATTEKDWLNFPVRQIENGRFLQRADFPELTFADAQGQALEGRGRLEIVAWPDRLAWRLEFTPKIALTNASLELRLTRPTGSQGERSPASDWPAGELRQAGTWMAFDPQPEAVEEGVSATGLRHPNTPVQVRLDPVRGWHAVQLPPENWRMAEDLDHLDRFSLALRNPSDQPRTFRLLFAKDHPFEGVTGLTPMLRDSQGHPTGIPVQISKNWHARPERPMLYEGPWLHSATVLRLPPHSRVEGEFNITYGHWGGVPAASHAQLCLIGWGWNQLWDEAAIGSWGESICYEADALQQRCRIDDIRPLMVWGMGEGRRKWNWTHNVGGGDFLVYYDASGEYLPWRGVRTAYLCQGPNLTDVTYSGVTADGAIATRIRVSTPRSDDLNRAYHHLRYEVLKPVAFSRLAFYQVGSDNYHWHQYNRLARGNTDGLLEEWDPGRGGKRYLRRDIPCPGPAPWFSLHDGVAKDNLKPVQGAWATRGLVIRSWRARLGGQDAPPFAAVYGTEAGTIPSANLELCAPPGITKLLPGDFVEAELELLILPMAAADYYGPNENLRQSLATQANTWRAVHRQATGNDLRLRALRGRILQAYPPVIAIGMEPSPAATVEITGGVGFVPVTFAGLPSPRELVLTMVKYGRETRVDQAVHGNDYWQTVFDPVRQTWTVTYNVPLDSPEDKPQTVELRFRVIQPSP